MQTTHVRPAPWSRASHHSHPQSYDASSLCKQTNNSIRVLPLSLSLQSQSLHHKHSRRRDLDSDSDLIVPSKRVHNPEQPVPVAICEDPALPVSRCTSGDDRYLDASLTSWGEGACRSLGMEANIQYASVKGLCHVGIWFGAVWATARENLGDRYCTGI